jgi:seryl-tRNA synthetase
MVKKKSVNFIIYIPILTIAVGLIASWVKFQAQAEQTKTKVEEVAKEIKEVEKDTEAEIGGIKDDIKETEKAVSVNKTQQDNIQAQVQQISVKSDKIYELLIELKEKKK